MKTFKIPMIIFSLMIGLTILLVSIVDSEQKQYKDLVGSMVVIKKDTLMVTDYNRLFENVTLDNGVTISFELAKKLKLNNK